MLNEMLHDATGNTILFAVIPLFVYLVFSVLATAASWFLYFMKMRSFDRTEDVGGVIFVIVIASTTVFIISTGVVT